MTISDQAWKYIMEKRGKGAINFSPQVAGEMLDEYNRMMTELGYCSYCEGKLNDENHPDGKCIFKEHENNKEQK